METIKRAAPVVDNKEGANQNLRRKFPESSLINGLRRGLLAVQAQTIGIMANHPPGVSVVTPIDPAIGRMTKILFHPFDLTKWLAIGFCAWLADMGRYGSSYNHASARSQTPGQAGPPEIHTYLENARTYAEQNLIWIVPLAIVLIVIALALMVLILWLQSRGAFMFLHCVALNRGEVKVPWRKYEREAHSLWLFKLGLCAVGLVLVLPIALWAAVEFTAAAGNLREFYTSVFPFLVVIVILWICFFLPLGIVSAFTRHFVVPIMYLKGGTCMDGWRVLLTLIADNPGRFILYVLFEIVIGICIAAVVIGFIVCTCCIGVVLLIIPYVGSVVMLPITIFMRSYSAIYLAQYGAEFDVFGSVEPPAQEPPALEPGPAV